MEHTVEEPEYLYNDDSSGQWWWILIYYYYYYYVFFIINYSSSNIQRHEACAPVVVGNLFLLLKMDGVPINPNCNTNLVAKNDSSYDDSDFFITVFLLCN